MYTCVVAFDHWPPATVVATCEVSNSTGSPLGERRLREIAPYAGEAKMLWEEGATVEQIDKAASTFGASERRGHVSVVVLPSNLQETSN